MEDLPCLVMFRSNLLLYFMSPHHSLPFSSWASQLTQYLFSQSVWSAAPWFLLPGLGTDMPTCFLLKVGGWKQCFPLQSPHHNFDALQIFFPLFFVPNAGDSPTGWKELAGTSTNGQLIGFMVQLAVQNVLCLILVFNTQFDVNLKTFYIILLHTCTHAACQTKCGVMNVISFLWAAGTQNSWEGIYLCQHGRRADYCKRWEKKVRVWIYRREGGRQNCRGPKALGTHDCWM